MHNSCLAVTVTVASMPGLLHVCVCVLCLYRSSTCMYIHCICSMTVCSVPFVCSVTGVRDFIQYIYTYICVLYYIYILCSIYVSYGNI